MRGDVMVCVDRRDEAGVCGRVLQQGGPPALFTDVNGMLSRIETVLEHQKYPAASMRDRTFSEAAKGKGTAAKPGDADMGERARQAKGNKATFVVQVQYRQNATWQGKVVWSERNETRTFRSALELIKLIDSATEEAEIE